MVDAMTNFANPNTGQRGGTYTPGPNVLALTNVLMGQGQGQGQQPQQQSQSPMPTPPNNWQTALHAMADPGKVTTGGATVPLAQSFQPAGGVNQAFLNQAGGGGNRAFQGALAAIQNRQQQPFT